MKLSTKWQNADWVMKKFCCSLCFCMHILEHIVLFCLHVWFCMLAYVHMRVHACVFCVYLTAYAQLSGVTGCYRGGSMCTHATPLTPGCHCALVMINHVLQRRVLFGREGTNHTPHYPGLVTPQRSSPRTPQPVAVWRRRGRAASVKEG